MRTALWLLIPSVLAACGGRGGIPLEPLPWEPERPLRPEPQVKVDLTDGLDVEEAVALAIEKNPRFKGARLGTDLARARQVIAETYPHNPELGIESGRALPFSKLDDFAARLSISQVFEIGGQRGYRIAAAEADVERSIAVLADDRRLLRAQVVGQFYELLFLEQRQTLAAQNVELAQKFLEAAEARLRARQIPEIEVNLVRLDLARAKTERDQAVREARIARAKLAGLIGQPDRLEFALKGELGAIVVIPDRQRLHRTAAEGRADLRAARARAKVTEEQVRLAQAPALREVRIGLFGERETAIFETGGGTLSDRDNVVGIDLTIPLPFLNTLRGERLEAEIERRRATIEIEAIIQEIQRDVETAVARLEAARTVVESYERDLNKLAQQNLDDTVRAYQAGEVGTLQVLRAQDDLNRVRAAYVEAQFGLRLSLAEIDAAIGAKITEVK